MNWCVCVCVCDSLGRDDGLLCVYFAHGHYLSLKVSQDCV